MWRQHQIHLIKQKHYKDGELDVDSANLELATFLDSVDEGVAPRISGSGRSFSACCLGVDQFRE